MGMILVPAAKNPYYSQVVGGVGLAAGAEAANAITVTGQLRKGTRADLDVRGLVRCWLSSDQYGEVPLRGHNMPSGGYATGTDGTIAPGAKPEDGLHQISTLAIHSTPEQFKTTTTALYTAGGYSTSKAATTALTFTAAHTVTASKYGCVLVQVNASGTISTKVATATQAYNTAAAALAALPAPDAGKCALGYIAIANNAGDWVANTDDLTNGSDLTTATFVDNPANGMYSPTFDVIAEADGDFDIVVTETRINPMWLCVGLPDGSIATVSLPFA